MDSVDLLVISDANLNGDNLFSNIWTEVIHASEDDFDFFKPSEIFYNKDKLVKKEKEEFLAHFENYVAQFKPKCILVLGDLPTSLIVGGRGVGKKAGAIQMYQETYPVICIQSLNESSKSQNFLMGWTKAIHKSILISKDIPSSSSPTKMVYCDTLDKIKVAVKYVVQTGLAVFDFEAPKIDENLGTFHPDHVATMVSFSFQAGSGYVIPLEHKDTPFSPEEITRIFAYLKKHIFENPNIRKVAHNLSYDAHICRMYGIKLRGRLDDTMLMHHLYDEAERHGLKKIVEDLYPEYAGYDDEIKGLSWSQIPIMMLAQYNATDTDLTYRILVALESWLLEDERVYRIYRNLTMAAWKMLHLAETVGMSIDAQFLSKSIREVKILIQRQKSRLDNHKKVKIYTDFKRIEETDVAIDEVERKLASRIEKSKEVARKGAIRNLEKKYKKNPEEMPEGLELKQALRVEEVALYSTTKFEENYKIQLQKLKSGEETAYAGINYGSWQQLEDLLYYNKHGFKFPTIDGGTGKDILNDLKDTTGFVELILSYRSLKKLLSTYLEGIFNKLDHENRVHASFNLHGTVSGRLSCSNPNLQNIPNTAKLRDETLIQAVGLVKKSFNVPEGHTLEQYDYSQAELRTIAHFAKEDTMLEVYNNDLDLHAKTASEMMELTLEKFYELDKSKQKEGRSNAKAVNFGLIYGMGAYGFMEYAKHQYGLILTLPEAEKIRDTFFDTYPKLLDYHDTYIAKGKKFGWVRTLYGRRRRLPKINDQDEYIASMDERAAINSPIQGTSGEFMIFAIALLYWRLDRRVKFINTVHDSIIFYVPNDMLDYAHRVIKDTMENLPNMQYFGVEMETVKMAVDIEASTESWKDLKEI